ncbi:hypothetical protein [Caulobacter mirabilis]|uniref:Uncharacterized protein n=1 Tax=Caulobacter mirabilis TaxID=69666 RepID=A0A2D2AVX1_9CAUL|nr:hypothetical protein [Caulobacter mirabilis]ATQ42158.1 hypothetical protein CSW64_06885 [Caulobacter mirabilis]
MELRTLASGATPAANTALAHFACALEELRKASRAKIAGAGADAFEDQLARRWLGGHASDGLKVYTGRLDEPSGGPPRVWAAIEVLDGALAALIKTSLGYEGSRDDFDARLAEAQDRRARGQKQPW